MERTDSRDEHSPTSATGTGWERTPWHTTQCAAWDALKADRPSGIPATNEPMTEPDVSVFSHNPSWLVMGLTLEGFVVYGIILLVRDPDVVSVNGVIFGAPLTATSVGVIPLIHRFWRCSLTFRISKERLVVVHQFLRTSHEVEWSSIVAVETVPQSLLAWGAALRFSRIVVQGRNEFVFAPHLQRYPVFLEELKARAMNCKAFTPQVIAGIVNKSP